MEHSSPHCPLFSIVIPLYNKQQFIERTLQSVRSQTFTDYEVVIVNDGSTDDSEQKVLSANDLPIRYFRTENRGVSAARNLGIEQARGEFIAFLDADDCWHPHYLQQVAHYIRLLPQHVAFGTAVEFECGKRIVTPPYLFTKTGDYEVLNFFEASMGQAVFLTSATVLKKSLLEQTGLFDVTIRSGQDTDLWIRVGLLVPVVFIWRVGMRYVHDSASLSRNITSLKDKSNYTKYKHLEVDNVPLKRFIDLNRYSLALKSRLLGDEESYRFFTSEITPGSLPHCKRFLLGLPRCVLLPLVSIKNLWTKFGRGHSVFVR